jgi:hypothetical protein
MPRPSPRCDWLALWILWSAWCAVSGWVLSAFGQLDRVGYAACIALFLIGVAIKRRFWEIRTARPSFLVRRSTYARLLPAGWLVLALLALVGGLIYYPDNYDYLSYRFPRVLHWWWTRHWYWIETPNERQNIPSVGMEWLMAPLFVLFRTDRHCFLINGGSFLFMPGLIFSVFRSLGISGRVAWWWMWLLPTGFCFLLQAASMGNDGFAAVYFLAALYYAFRADERSPQALVLSVLSIALITGVKPSNLPLVLPWLAVLWLRRGPVLDSVRPLFLLGACIVGAVCSFLPTAVANIHYTGNYSGDPQNFHQVQIKRPRIGIIGNSIEIATANFAPPLWPREIQWPTETEVTRALRPDYPRFGYSNSPFPIEEVSGVGLGVTVLTGLGMVYGLGNRRRRLGQVAWVIGVTTLLAWLGYMAKMGSEAAPRLVAPYYVLGIAALLLLLPPDGRITHRRVWRGVGYVTMISAILLLIINPARPLLEVRWIAGGLHALRVPDAAVARLESNFQRREVRRDFLGALREKIPKSETVVGFLSGSNDPGVSLWLPFGSHEVINLLPTSDPAACHVRYVVVSAIALRDIYRMTLPDLLAKWRMKVVQTEDATYKTPKEPDTWYLLQSN